MENGKLNKYFCLVSIHLYFSSTKVISYKEQADDDDDDGKMFVFLCSCVFVDYLDFISMADDTKNKRRMKSSNDLSKESKSSVKEASRKENEK